MHLQSYIQRVMLSVGMWLILQHWPRSVRFDDVECNVAGASDADATEVRAYQNKKRGGLPEGET